LQQGKKKMGNAKDFCKPIENKEKEGVIAQSLYFFVESTLLKQQNRAGKLVNEYEILVSFKTNNRLPLSLEF